MRSPDFADFDEIGSSRTKMTLESNGSTFPLGAGDGDVLGLDVGAGVGGTE